MKINPHTTLKCVADYVGAKKMIGDPNFVISGLNEIHEVVTKQLFKKHVVISIMNCAAVQIYLWEIIKSQLQHLMKMV